MERLTTHDPDRQLFVCSANYKSWDEIYDRLAYYEDLEEQGRLVVLPCKVGDKYYQIRKFCDMGGDDDFGEHGGSDCEYYCTTPECKHEKRIVEGVFTSVISILTREHLGKHYLTRAEAEAAMKGVTDDA